MQKKNIKLFIILYIISMNLLLTNIDYSFAYDTNYEVNFYRKNNNHKILLFYKEKKSYPKTCLYFSLQKKLNNCQNSCNLYNNFAKNSYLFKSKQDIEILTITSIIIILSIYLIDYIYNYY